MRSVEAVVTADGALNELLNTTRRRQTTLHQLQSGIPDIGEDVRKSMDFLGAVCNTRLVTLPIQLRGRCP